MKSICKKFTSAFCIFLILISSVHITPVNAFEKKNKVSINLLTKVSKANAGSVKTASYSKVNEGDNTILHVSFVPSTASTTIQVPLELNKDESVTLYQNESRRTFNSGNIYNGQNRSKGIIDVEIVNNDEQAQLTTTVLDNNNLQLNVQSNNILSLVEIQVKMKATSFSTYFTNSEWINRGKMASLSLSQKADITSSTNPNLNYAIKIDAWDKIKSIHDSDTNWYNAGGMQDQFDCHFDFAKKKNAWNLEPSRPDVDYFATVMASCNPK